MIEHIGFSRNFQLNQPTAKYFDISFWTGTLPSKSKHTSKQDLGPLNMYTQGTSTYAHHRLYD